VAKGGLPHDRRVDGAPGERRADRRRRRHRGNSREHFGHRGRWNGPLVGHWRPQRFGGWPIRARLGTRHGNADEAVLFHVRTFGAFFDGDSHRPVGFILDGIGDVESVIAAQLDRYVFID